GLACGEGVPREERDRLAGVELEAGEGRAGEVRVLREVRLSERAERADTGQPPVVQRGGERPHELCSGALVAGEEAVRLAEECRANDVVRGGRTKTDEVARDRRAVELAHVSLADAGLAPHADAGRDAVRGNAVVDGALYD